MLWEESMKYAMNTGAGVFTVLFIALLAWVLKTNNERENRYIATIDKLGERLAVVEKIQGDVGDIKDMLNRRGD